MPFGSIGPFRIERELGRGGMGEVHLARDTRLDRLVAIKSLPAHLAQDPERLARFEREAKLLASLSHPGIAAIYGLEEAQGHRYLVLEYVEGGTLAERIASGPMPVGEVLAIARQIAEALEAAHEKGIVHRDLKPGNVMVTPEGAVKVLDFGLARSAGAADSAASHAALADSPTIATLAGLGQGPTVPGVILGTVGYMSPEQARGTSVDRRSDIFSFGCVLYEMLTGVAPFRTETVADSIAAILHREPDLTKLPADLPRRARELLSSCLTKDRRNRLHDIGDARLELERAIAEPRDPGAVATGPASRGSRAVLAVAAAVAIVGGTFPLWSHRVGLGAGAEERGAAAPRTARQVVRFTIDPPEGFALPLFIGEGTGIAISPDSDRIVFVAEANKTSHLCVHDVARGVSRVLPNTEACTTPFFSPDGRWLGFVSKGRLMKMPADGGPAVTICEINQFASFAWLDDGTIVWGGAASGVWRVRAEGGKPELLALAGRDSKPPEGGTPALGFDVPVSVPGADYILCGSWDGPTTESFNVLAVSLKDGSLRTVLRTAAEPRLLEGNRLLFLRGTTVMSVGFDAERGVVVGDPTVALEGVRTDQWQDSAYLGASPSGSFAYVPGGRFGADKRLVRVSEAGVVTPMLDTTDNYSSIAMVSPDGRRAVVTTLRSRIEMWVLDLERRSMALVSSPGEHYGTAWSQDGASILAAYVAPDGTSALARWSASGGGTPSILPGTSMTDDLYLPMQELHDGSGLLVQHASGGVVNAFRLLTYDYAQGAFSTLRTRIAQRSSAAISPDGRWVTYVSDESGRAEVYLGPMKAPGPNVQVSTKGGGWPKFSPDGTRLFYLDLDDVMTSVSIDMSGAAPQVSAPKTLFDARALHVQAATRGGFDLLPDGDFILIERAAWEREPPVIHVILHWADELRRGDGGS